MRRILLLIFWQFGLLAGGRLFADVVTLKDGHQISGLVETGNIQQLHIKVGDQSQTIDIHEVQAIQFGIFLPAAPPPQAADPASVPPLPAAQPPAKAAELATELAPVTAGAATGAASAALVTGAVALIGVVVLIGAAALMFAGERGKGVTNAPPFPFANRLTQPAFIDSKRGRQ
jgi:hypothetical protein